MPRGYMANAVVARAARMRRVKQKKEEEERKTQSKTKQKVEEREDLLSKCCIDRKLAQSEYLRSKLC